MIFLYPYFLTLFALPLLMWILLAHTQRTNLFSQEVRQRLSTANYRTPYTSNRYTWLLLFALIVIALARPVWLKEMNKEGQKLEMSFLAISLDISKSMLASDITPNRLEFSKRAITDLFQKMPDFKIALNAFSRDVFMVSPFTDDKETLKFLLENLNQESMTSEGSSIEAVMLGAEKMYAPFNREIKDVLIVTDGADGLGVKEAIQKALQNHLRVHLLLVGTKEGVTLKESSGKPVYDSKGHEVITKRADELQELSHATGGVYVVTSGSLSDLGWLSEQIRLKTQKEESELMQKRYADELFYYPLGMAILLIFFMLNALEFKHLKHITLPLMLFLFFPQNLHCEIFDFWSIIKAEALYTHRDHQEALAYFQKVDTSKKSDISQYNLANSYYRNKDFAKAAQLYADINSTNEVVNYERLHNLGNTYAKLGRKKDAIAAYEKALKIKEDPATRFNLTYLQADENKVSPSDEQEQKKQEEEKSQDQQTGKQQQDQNKSKEDEKEPQSQAPKPMDAQEAQKWEKMLKATKPQTKPQALIKNEQTEKKSEIFW